MQFTRERMFEERERPNQKKRTTATTPIHTHHANYQTITHWIFIFPIDSLDFVMRVCMCVCTVFTHCAVLLVFPAKHPSACFIWITMYLSYLIIWVNTWFSRNTFIGRNSAEWNCRWPPPPSTSPLRPSHLTNRLEWV